MMFGNAEAYEQFMGRWSRVAAPLLLDYAGLPDTGSVLDIGSGSGSLTFEIAERNAGMTVVGIDPSKEFIAFATTRNPFSDRVSFQVAAAQDLHFADTTFAACVSLLVFNFIPDPDKALRQARRVTQPGGGITAAVWDYGAGMGMLRAFWDAATDVDAGAGNIDEKHMPLCRAGELSQLWRQCGLENIQEHPLEVTMKFDSFADYWEPFLLGQGPAGAYLRSLTSDQTQLLRRVLKSRLSLSSESEAFALPARLWAVRGCVPAH